MSARNVSTTGSAVHVERLIDCPFSLAIDEAERIVAILESPTGGVRVPFQRLGLPFAGGLTHNVGVRFERRRDLDEPGRLHDEIGFDWDARARLLPNFRGVLRFRIESLQTRIILDGEYRPPLGRFGVFFDRLIGRRLAAATVRDLVDRLASDLEARWAADRRG